MALKTFRPLTPASRFKALPDFAEITKDKPEKALLETLKKSGGRNNNGRMTMRHRDPNRSARIALLQYTDGEKAYIIAPIGLSVGAKVSAGVSAEPAVGNALPLKSIPLGTTIHNVELISGRGAQIVRSAGGAAVLANREAGFALVKLPSGEIRKINAECYATIGQVGNSDHMNVSSGKAGRTRWLGRRPHVRGMVMNPVDHPMGGGQGKSKGGGGRHHPMSPWGQLAKGFKTRRKHKPSDRFIVQRRKGKVKN